MVFVVLSSVYLFRMQVRRTSPRFRRLIHRGWREAFRLGDWIGDRIWPGWSKAPFAVLLVTPEHEFLIRHPKPSADFTSLGYDPSLKSDVYYRKRNFPAHFLATFPAISGSMISTIVVGRAENTSAKTSTPWVITLLHEHFHQLQDSQPNFYTEVNALNLSRGDQTGMWMLNYAFPYERPDVQQQFSAMSQVLAAAVQPPRPPGSERAKERAPILKRGGNFSSYSYLTITNIFRFNSGRRESHATPNTKSRGWPRQSTVRARTFSPSRTIAHSRTSPNQCTTKFSNNC